MSATADPHLSYGSNDDRIKKLLAQRSSASKPSINHLSGTDTLNLMPDSNMSHEFFDDVIVDPHHISVATFSTVSSYMSSSSTESTDSMVFSSSASPSNTTANSMVSNLTAVTSMSFTADTCPKNGQEALSFLESNVPPINTNPTQFNMQRMVLSGTEIPAPVASSNSSIASGGSQGRKVSAPATAKRYTHQHTPSMTPSTISYSTQFNRINGANLLGSSSPEYGKFGKIVANSVSSLSSLDSLDSSSLDSRGGRSSGPRRLFEKSKGTAMVINPPYGQRVSDHQLDQHLRQPSISNFGSASLSSKASSNTINKSQNRASPKFDENTQFIGDAFDPNLYTNSNDYTTSFGHNNNNHHNNHHQHTPSNIRGNHNDRLAFSLGLGFESSSMSNSTSSSNPDLSSRFSNLSLGSDGHTKLFPNTSQNNTVSAAGIRMFADLDGATKTISTKSSTSNNGAVYDPTDLSSAFSNLHSSNNSVSTRRGRRSSFHVINSSDFTNGYASSEDEAVEVVEEATRADQSNGNEKKRNHNNNKNDTKHMRKRSNSVGSTGSRESVHLDLNLDLDSVIHSALVESTQAHHEFNTHSTPHSHYSDSIFNHNMNNDGSDFYPASTTASSSSFPTGLDYSNDLQHLTFHDSEVYVTQSNSTSASSHHGAQRNGISKFGTSMKRFAKKIAISNE